MYPLELPIFLIDQLYIKAFYKFELIQYMHIAN